MKRNNIFRIEFPDKAPLYIFTKYGYTGLINIINDEHAKRGGMIYPLTYWKFIKEWLNGNKRTKHNKL
jgi:hypothetical protein